MHDREVLADIRTIHADNLGVYGARKVHASLKREGMAVARCTVERLMKAVGLQGIPRLTGRKTTYSDGAETPRPADRVQRQFVADAPNVLWVANRTHIRAHSGCVYAAFVLDVGYLGGTHGSSWKFPYRNRGWRKPWKFGGASPQRGKCVERQSLGSQSRFSG